jgi:hypothetical protein
VVTDYTKHSDRKIVNIMDKQEITLSLPKDQLDAIRKLDKNDVNEVYEIAMNLYLERFFSSNNDIVYKYRCWNDVGKRALINNEFFLASAQKANDPFELHIPLDYASLDNNVKIELFLDVLISSMPSHVQSHMHLQKPRMLTEFKKDPKKIADQHSQNYFHVNDKYLGLFCLSEKWNNVLMWSHYSNCHEGFCIGLNRKKLIEIKLHQEMFFGGYGPVGYYINLPKIDPLDHLTPKNIMIEQMSKAWDWGYEKEVRFTKLFDNIPTDNDRKFQLSDDYFEEIIIGLNAPIDQQNEIRLIADKRKIPVYKITRQVDSFDLFKELI